MRKDKHWGEYMIKKKYETHKMVQDSDTDRRD